MQTERPLLVVPETMIAGTHDDNVFSAERRGVSREGEQMNTCSWVDVSALVAVVMVIALIRYFS